MINFSAYNYWHIEVVNQTFSSIPARCKRPGANCLALIATLRTQPQAYASPGKGVYSADCDRRKMSKGRRCPAVLYLNPRMLTSAEAYTTREHTQSVVSGEPTPRSSLDGYFSAGSSASLRLAVRSASFSAAMSSGAFSVRSLRERNLLGSIAVGRYA